MKAAEAPIEEVHLVSSNVGVGPQADTRTSPGSLLVAKFNLDLIQRTAENEWRLIVIAHGRASVAASLLGEISLTKLIAAGLIFAL